MNLQADDPKLTAYALGELSEDEAAAIENAIAGSAEAHAWVADVRELAATMRAGFDADLVERKRLSIMPLSTVWSFWSEDHWPIAAAAVLTIAALVAAVILGGTPREGSPIARVPQTRGPADVQMEFEREPLKGEIDTAGTLTGQGYRFVATGENPLATFPIEVGKASYLDVQRSIASGSLPRRATVRIEDMINYFAYDEPQPESGRPFSITAEVAGCPWRAGHRLVRIVLKASGVKGGAALNVQNEILAREVTAQVEFNPTRVSSYRLVGYDQTLKDGATGEIHSGDAVTILYEIVPSGMPAQTAETLVVKVHYKQPAGAEAEVAEEVLTDEGQDYVSASPDFKFAAAVAEFGMFLRNSSVENRRTLGAIAELANKGRGSDRDGRRAGFIELIRQTQLLTRG